MPLGRRPTMLWYLYSSISSWLFGSTYEGCSKREMELPEMCKSQMTSLKSFSNLFCWACCGIFTTHQGMHQNRAHWIVEPSYIFISLNPLALIHGFEMPQTIKNLPSEGSSNFLSANSTSPILFRPNLWESISTKTSMPFCDEYRQIRLVMWRSLSIPRWSPSKFLAMLLQIRLQIVSRLN